MMGNFSSVANNANDATVGGDVGDTGAQGDVAMEDANVGNDGDDTAEEPEEQEESEEEEEVVAPPPPKYAQPPSDGVDHFTGLLSGELIFSTILAPYLNYSDLRKVVFLSRGLVHGLTYEAVLRCTRNSGYREFIQGLLYLTECLPYSSIYVPSPVRLLRILSPSRRCEHCNNNGLAERQQWPGLFLCAACSAALSAPVPLPCFSNKGWGCPDMQVAMNATGTDQPQALTSLLAQPFSSSILGKQELVGPVVTVQGLQQVIQQEPQLLVTFNENPELLFEPLTWRNTVNMIQQIVAETTNKVPPPTHFECDLFFRLMHRYACQCRRCWSNAVDDCPKVMGTWEAFFGEY